MEGFSIQQLQQSSSLLPYCAFPEPEPLLGFPVRSYLEAAMAYETSSSSSLDTSTAIPMVFSQLVMQLHEGSPPESAAGNGGGKTRMVGIQGSSTTSLGSSQEKDGSGGKGRKQKRPSNVGVKGAQEKRARGHDGEPPAGYIHVRARRGQATDYHSRAERLRRERISERMTMLQSLVPGCDKVTGTARMLDEIISYVQSLQNQVEFLSMKLASLNPMLYEFGLDMDMYPIVPQHEKVASQLPQQLVQCIGQGIVLTTGPPAAAAHASLEAQGPTAFGQDGSSRVMPQGEEPLHHQGNSICFFQ